MVQLNILDLENAQDDSNEELQEMDPEINENIAEVVEYKRDLSVADNLGAGVTAEEGPQIRILEGSGIVVLNYGRC